MKFIIGIVTALAICTLAATAAEAKKGAPKADPETYFKKLDKDGDGCVTLEEFKASGSAKKDPAKAEEAFKKKDKNGDGKLSLDEFKGGGGKKGKKKE
jgi:Ca2+-binding EF-hand superfamily protein